MVAGMKGLIFAVGLAAALSGCGGTSNLDVCYAVCSYGRRCLNANDATYTNCRNDCDKASGAKSDQDQADARTCSNAADLRAGQISCYNNQACGEVVAGAGCLLQSAVSSLNSRCVRP